MRKIATILTIVLLSIAMVLVLNAIYDPGGGGEATTSETGAEDTHLVQPAQAAEADHGHEAETEHGHATEAEHGHEVESAPAVEADHAHAEEVEHGHGEQADHGHEAEAVVAVVAEHGHDEEVGHGHETEAAMDAEAGHGHGETGIGYIGLDTVEHVDEQELDTFVERVKEEAYLKADLDEARFIIFGLFFVLVFLSYAKIKGVSKRLTAAVDWYTMGTVAGLILVVLVIPSGIIITFFYMPTSTGVYSSVEAMAQIPALAFFRNLHNWSSEIFVILMLLHGARTISTNTYMGNRKFIWFTGAVLFVVGFLAFLSGSFMRGDQEALEGFEHMMFAFNSIPLGAYVADFLSGELTIMKLTAIHLGATTFAMIVLVAVHVLMRKVFVHVQRRWRTAVIYTAIITALLVVQSIFMEAPFIRGLEAGPTVTGMEITKPPWPIYFMIGAENLFGATAMVYSLLVFVPLLILPYALDWLPTSRVKKLEIGESAYYTGVFLLIALSFWAAAGQIVPHIFH